MKRAKKTKKATTRAKPRATKTRARRATHADAQGTSSVTSSNKSDSMLGSFGQPLSKMLAFQRSLLKASAGAAMSAVDNPASRLVTGGVTGSLQGGLKKLEEVFDERVAAALARMGMPSPALLQELIDRVDALTETLNASAGKRKVE